MCMSYSREFIYLHRYRHHFLQLKVHFYIRIVSSYNIFLFIFYRSALTRWPSLITAFLYRYIRKIRALQQCRRGRENQCCLQKHPMVMNLGARKL